MWIDSAGQKILDYSSIGDTCRFYALGEYGANATFWSRPPEKRNSFRYLGGLSAERKMMSSGLRSPWQRLSARGVFYFL